VEELQTQTNPFAAPEATDAIAVSIPGDSAVLGDIEATRRRLLSHEASIRSAGTLYLLGFVGLALPAVFALFGCLATLPQLTRAPNGVEALIPALLMTLVLAAFAALYYYIGMGLRRLDPKVRTVSMIMTGFGLLGFPIGTLISGYILYLLACEKGKEVLSVEYQGIVAATPHIKYRTSIVVWILVGLLVVGLLGAFLGAVLRG